jgi:hypothetical protein
MQVAIHALKVDQKWWSTIYGIAIELKLPKIGRSHIQIPWLCWKVVEETRLVALPIQ